jgi:hypothetical protein
MCRLRQPFAGGDWVCVWAFAADGDLVWRGAGVDCRAGRPADALRSGSRTTAAGASLLQRVLVVLQAALSLVLLVGAGLFSQSLSKLESTDLKLDATNRYIVHINPQAAGYSQTQVEALYRTMEERFHAMPGVVKVGISNYTPMEDDNWSNSIGVQGQPDPHGSASFVKGECGVFRFGGNAGGDGARDRRAGYFDGAAGGGGESGVCEDVFQGRKSDRAADWFAGPRREILRWWGWWKTRYTRMCAGRITACFCADDAALRQR